MKTWKTPELTDLEVKMTMDQIASTGFDGKRDEANNLVPGLGDLLGS